MDREETIYQSFNESDLSQLRQAQEPPEGCVNCRSMQEYISKLEQEVEELNRRFVCWLGLFEQEGKQAKGVGILQVAECSSEELQLCTAFVEADYEEPPRAD